MGDGSVEGKRGGGVHRFRSREDSENVRRILQGLPARIRAILRPIRYVTRYDPAFLGIHGHITGRDGRAYASTSHCVWPPGLMHRPATDRPVTVFLQGEDVHDPAIVRHELGHALDWMLDLYRAPVVPLSGYAERGPDEAFATAFQAWATGGATGRRNFPSATLLRARDPGTAAFLDRLSGR